MSEQRPPADFAAQPISLDCLAPPPEAANDFGAPPDDRRAEVKLSLVVSTLGRSNELRVLLDSLQRQELKSFEVIIVDQNDDERLVPVLESSQWSFPVTHLHQPGTRGVNRGRNEGWRRARGAYVLFPDDDCWYPPALLARGLHIAEHSGADFVTGRAADETGRNINGRFGPTAHRITRRNAWVSAIEWMIFFKRTSLETLGGFDETIGPGSGSLWQANEGHELILRALRLGMPGVYDPSLFAHHAELNIYTPDEAMIRKGRAYARGMGFVLRKSGYGPLWAAYWIARASVNSGLALARGNAPQFRYYSNLVIGRLEGYLKHPLPL